MGILNRDKRFSDLIKVLKNSKLSSQNKRKFVDYLDKVKNNERNNDFFEDDFLEKVFLEIISQNANENTIDFDEILEKIKIIFPYGKSTENYELLKDFFITNLYIISSYFEEKLFALFDNKRDYLDIISIISSSVLYKDYFFEIADFAIAVAPYCQNQSILKSEIIAFINKIGMSDNISDLSDECILEAKKRVGIYPVDEKTLAIIASEVKKAQGLIMKLDNLQGKIGNYQQEVNTLVKKGREELIAERQKTIEELNTYLEETKKELLSKLDDYLAQIEKELRASSDKVFKQVLMEASQKINEVKIMASNLSSRTTDELLRIQKQSEESVSRLKEFVEQDPKVKELITEAGGESKLKELLSNLQLTGTLSTPSSTGIYIPGNDRLVVPMNARVQIPDQIDSQVIPIFDESIPFDKRMQLSLDRMDEMKKNGELFHELTEEIVRCVIEGDWVYLWGPSGCGKSYVIKQVAKIIGLDLIENGKITDKYSIMAYNDPHGRFRATQAFVALVYGKMLSLDEFDNGNTDTQVVLNELYSGLLDVLERPLEKRFITFAEDMSVPVNINFRMISAGNTSGEGENSLFSSRGKIDEAVQERMTPKRFFYDNRVERLIFQNLDAWYELFVNFRKICDDYAKKMGLDSAPGMVTTRDASAIAKYVSHNSKTLDQVLREKFVQIKSDEYLKYIVTNLKNIYGIEKVTDVPEVNLADYSSKDLAKKLIYTCNTAINSGRR